MMPSFPIPKPGHLFLPGCAIAAGLLTVTLPSFADSTVAPATTASLRLVSDSAEKLRVGETISLPLFSEVKVHVESGTDKVLCVTEEGNLSIKALETGPVKIRLEVEGQEPEILNFDITPKKVRSSIADKYVIRRDVAQVVPATPPTSDPLPDFLRGIPAPSRDGAPAPASNPTGLPPLVPISPAPGTLPPTELPPVTTEPATPPPAVIPPTELPPAETTPAVSTPAPALAPRVAPPTSRSIPTISAGAAQVGPNLPPPSKSNKVSYPTRSSIPASVKTSGARSNIQVAQGLARVLSFPANILSVFFSDPGVMDARAINARNLAVTGVSGGESTLVVFTSTKPGDVIGKANIYRIQTTPRGGIIVDARDPGTIQTAIESALNDPRIRVRVSRIPDGTLSASLAGTVRNDAEVQGAATTAKLYVPTVVSSLYADPKSLTLEQALAEPQITTTPLEELQTNIRRVTGNNSIELIPFPTGTGLKAEVGSVEEAEQLMSLLPTMGQQIQPFIVIRGAASAENPYYAAPMLQGEDLRMTQTLRAVTGIRSVYAVRTSGNSVAIYGTVATREEYDTVNRYSQILPQLGAPIPVAGTSQGGATIRPSGAEQAIGSYNPDSAYQKQAGVKMFVRITDPAQSVIRNVTVDTSIVEITHNALRNLGVEYGSATTLTENIAVDANGNRTITRTIDPAFSQGSLQLGNGFGGLGGFGKVDPFRARINALVTNGDARILSNPNVSALEGMSAQITIGGERPVPSAVASIGSTGQSVEFRRFGVIITMRPTVNPDNTIILQIRADVTQPDPTYQINLNGAIIPGETVRSVDTTLTVRPGDVVVMGGLMSNEKRQQTSKVPVLGSLPIIGSLFRSRRFENNETELAIFMTPRIDAIPTTAGSFPNMFGAPGYPALPGRQESNQIFQNNTRAAGAQ